jgi:hypothetical protein
VDSDTQSIGEKVIDVSLIPYIRPQTIKIKVDGLKPYARHWAFFDGIDLSAYSTPLTAGEYANTVTTTASAEGAELRADSNGKVYLLLRLPPEKRFTFGTKRVEITDSPTNTDDATSLSTGYFVAQGINQVKQETTITTRQVIVLQEELSQSNTSSRIVQRVPSRSSVCMGYTYTVKTPNGEEGVFVTSFDVYCADKHPTLSVWFDVRELDAGGSITQNQIPFSEVWVDNANVPISANGTDNPLTVTFPSPIFLQNGKTYAFVIHPEAINPNYYFWVSRLGQVDINTNQTINSRIGTGSLFTTNNGYQWNMIEGEDLTITIRRAAFSTGVDGVATIGEKPRERFMLSSVSADLTRYGEVWSTGDKLTINQSGGPIISGDRLIGATSGANTTVRQIISTTHYMANTGYVAGESLTVKAANGVTRSVTASVATVGQGRATLQKFKSGANTKVATMVSSNGNFMANDYIFNFTTHDYATIDAISNFRYSVLDMEPSYLNWANTTIGFQMKTYSNTGVASSLTPFNPNEDFYFDDERAIYSRSNEIASLSSDRSLQIQTTMRSATSYLSPVLDVGRSQSIFVDSIINEDVTGETNASGGNLINKYISKTVTLANGQDAEDLQVVLTAYRPPTTDVKVWAKILHAEDSDLFSQRGWIELTRSALGDATYSSLPNRNDFLEFTYNFPAAYMIGYIPNSNATGAVQYTNSQGVNFVGFKHFAIKVGLLGSNSAVIPRVADLRVIATQM